MFWVLNELPVAQFDCFSLKILKTDLLKHDLPFGWSPHRMTVFYVFVNNKIFQLLNTHLQVDLEIHISICVPKEFFKL